MNALPRPRLLIIPGLRDSGPTHWQTWLEAQHADAVRVVQRDWASTDLERWAARLANTVERAGPGPWVAVAHSFGVLAVLRHLAQQPGSSVAAALLVAPADPDRFGLGEMLPQRALGVPATLVISENDPWMSAASARRWAHRWSVPVVSLGAAGHINAEAGYGPLPLAQRWVAQALHRLAGPAGAIAPTDADVPADAAARTPAALRQAARGAPHFTGQVTGQAGGHVTVHVAAPRFASSTF
jgi:predicted alpha/beta hydrolase family esterase